MTIKDSAEQIIKLLKQAAQSGHCFVNLAKLREDAGGSGDTTLTEAALSALVREGMLRIKDDKVYQPSLAASEDIVARFVVDRQRAFDDLAATRFIGATKIVAAIAAVEEADGIQLTDRQREAVSLAAHKRMVIITGGPGCGKTTIIKTISKLYRDSGLRLFLAAPTGKAAQRMGQVCDMNASTVHRLLKYDPKRRGFFYHNGNPIPAHCVIIDEASMLDSNLARDLFLAIPQNATLVLVGDKDQLPSVGPGRVFADIVASSTVPTVYLDTLFRQKEGSSIISVAASINKGIIPGVPELEGAMDQDVMFQTVGSQEEGAQVIERLACQELPDQYGIPPSGIAVLTPSNRGEMGVDKLNIRLQARQNLQPADSGIEVNGVRYRIGDRICQRTNNYQLDGGVFNGDQGVIEEINAGVKCAAVRLWDGRLINYGLQALKQTSLAYALSVHRSQGSEMPIVVLALHDAHFILLDRQLLYTAATRAKKALVIVGTRRALAMAVKRTSAGTRNSGLLEEIARLRLTAVNN